MVSKLEPVELTDVWAHEAKDFTTWLSENLDMLGGHIGLELSFIEREKAAGTFSADILAEDKEGQSVVIENQLYKTDHDHLGKVITYVANLNAKTAIWISSDPRPEHIASINYLNEVTPADTSFYLVKIQAFKIDGSDPAPLFSVVAGSDPEVKNRGDKKKELAKRDLLRLKFFENLLPLSNEKTKLFQNVSPSYQNWVVAGAGRNWMGWEYVVRLHDARVGLYITGDSLEQIKTRYGYLEKKKELIEKESNFALEWDFNENRKYQYIRSHSQKGGLLDEESWPEIHNDIVERMVNLENVLRKHIKSIPTSI